jgi:secretion/DNA translocation related TadE-like protein
MTIGPSVPSPKHPDQDRGVGTVLSAVVSLALITVLWLGIQCGMAVIARNRAEGAADLAALAAAGYAPQGEEFACSRAGWVARNMRTLITSCRLEGWDARVTVRADGVGALTGFPAVGSARAGPAAHPS